MRKYYRIPVAVKDKRKSYVIKALTTSEIFLILLYQEEYVIRQVIHKTAYQYTREIAKKILNAIEQVESKGGIRSHYIH